MPQRHSCVSKTQNFRMTQEMGLYLDHGKIFEYRVRRGAGIQEILGLSVVVESHRDVVFGL